MDQTEGIRRLLVSEINGDVETDDPLRERKRLEFEHGQVWDTSEMTSAFEATGFMAPFVMVKRKSDGIKGSLMFQHHPRFYFNFTPEDEVEKQRNLSREYASLRSWKKESFS